MGGTWAWQDDSPEMQRAEAVLANEAPVEITREQWDAVMSRSGLRAFWRDVFTRRTRSDAPADDATEREVA